MRLRRVEVLIQETIATLLSQKKVADGRIGFVTITSVKVNADLSLAKVYYSHFGVSKDRFKTNKGLQAASGFIHTQLCKKLHLKKVPTLRFIPDPSLEKGFEITEAIKDLSDV